ncbi:MAG: hypothetical protein IKU38_01440 [Clostridia bacterium]|nr:hypothetical protein [Clostridia bacterium]
MKHRLLPLFLLCSLYACSALGEQLTCIVRDGQYVNVRNQASARAATWGVLHTGDVIEANPAEIRNGFFKTSYKDHDAYVSVKFFEIAVGADYTVSANGRVRMRQSPGGSSSGFIQPGKRVHVLAWRYDEDGSKWGRCMGGSYISADCLAPME